MPPPLEREMLKAMKRADLQRICKDYGIKANLKTEALIELLVDTTQPTRPTPHHPPQRAPSTRIASRTVANPRLRGSSTSSVIIHDTDEEDNVVTDDQFTSGLSAPPSEASIVAVPPPRTRRAKETQYKLGVGRPIAAGGHGARAVTRTASLSQKGKRGKGSKSAKPTEAAIAEEEEPDPAHTDMPEAGPSGTTHEPSPAELSALHVSPPHIPNPIEHIVDPLDLAMLPVKLPDTSEQLKAYVNNLVAPIQTQVQLLQAELQQQSSRAADLSMLAAQVRSLQTEVDSLRPQAALVPQLQVEVNQLKQVVALFTQASTGMVSAPSQKSLGKARASDEGSSGTTVGGIEASHMTPAVPQAGFPGLSQSLLGKRQRDMNDSLVTDIVEAGQEDNFSQEDLDRRIVRPTKKRPKLSSQESGPSEPSSGEPVGEAASHPDGEGGAAPRQTFTIFQGPEEPPESYIDPPPPTTHLSDLFPFDPDSGQITPPNGGGAIPRPPGADENAPNQLPHNFNFSFNTSLFHPVTSTPFDMNFPPFTYPEPPASPSPAAPSGGFVERAGGRIERNDLFQPLRRPSQAPSRAHTPSRSQSAASRPASRAAAAGPSQLQRQGAPSTIGSAATINPSALMATSGLSTVPEAAEEGSSIPSVAMANGSGIHGLQRRTVSSTEVGIQLGMSSTLPLPPETPGGPVKRTMYGTELDSDTRFGDFGVEGVASGFWAGLARRT
ncbi:hypothetical protein L227DRAFT_497561 [Lentinus tigrinus ALCF2SS1-6]|uniref:Uncharacterized protein n=1 Tax=Lentinus tigrinus ALCF2SS1-6 TaxID=1328759 RepID=A0A5C2SIW4_9APHY|nr:hypothetical protein L227DRAFT_497561 [Lentinus tigrinus ALCF2SS1-6]